MNPNPANDQADLHLLRQGDDLALNRLMARWERRLCAFAWRYLQNATDARDLAVETFVRLHQQRLRLREDTNLSAWLFTTLEHLCHNQHRWRRRHPAVSLAAAGAANGNEAVHDASLSEPGPSPAEAVERDEALAALAAAIDRLPRDLKSTLLLHHYERLTYREVGEITGCSERGVETRLYRARRRLREELAGVLMQPAPT